MDKILGRKLTIIALIIFAVLALIFIAVFVNDILRRKKREIKYNAKETILAFALMLPAVALAFFLVVLPILLSLGYSFTDFALDPAKVNNTSFVGFAQFKTIFQDFKNHLEIYDAFKNTAIFVVLVVPLQITIALLLALFCNNKRKGTTIFKVCFFAPVAISLSVTAFLWAIILSPNADGVVNMILGKFGIEPKGFFKSRDHAIFWMVLISAWQGCGYQMLIFLSALGNIRKDLYEAAAMDGAGPFRRFFTITLPGLKPTMLYILITVFVGACRVMIQPMILTGDDTNGLTLSLYMYNQCLKNGSIAYSCAVAFLLTLLIGSITLLQRKLLGEKKR